ncbi:MAG: hypothetical protein KA004_07025 [Verrucomicrobiales bacterium]|nr:hypothetical protein [Verrucomicrobiales bacterium]
MKTIDLPAPDRLLPAPATLANPPVAPLPDQSAVSAHRKLDFSTSLAESMSRVRTEETDRLATEAAAEVKRRAEAAAATQRTPLGYD